MKNIWFVYIVECSDKTYYTGVTTDVLRRIRQHSSGKGAKYTRSRRPVKLLYCFQVSSRSLALKEEYSIKKMKRQEKLNYFKRRITEGSHE